MTNEQRENLAISIYEVADIAEILKAQAGIADKFDEVGLVEVALRAIACMVQHEETGELLSLLPPLLAYVVKIERSRV